MSNNTNSEILESAEADFEQFIAEKDWKNAQVIVDNLFDLQSPHASDFHKRLVAAQKRVPSVLEVMMDVTDKTIHA